MKISKLINAILAMEKTQTWIKENIAHQSIPGCTDIDNDLYLASALLKSELSKLNIKTEE